MICEALKTNNALTQLDLSGWSIWNWSIKEKDVKVNSWTDNVIAGEGARNLAKMLKTNTRLADLKIKQATDIFSRLGSAGVMILSKTLQNNSSLTSLNLSGEFQHDPNENEWKMAMLYMWIWQEIRLKKMHSQGWWQHWRQIQLSRLWIWVIVRKQTVVVQAGKEKDKNVLTGNLNRFFRCPSGAALWSRALENNSTLTSLNLACEWNGKWKTNSFWKEKGITMNSKWFRSRRD